MKEPCYFLEKKSNNVVRFGKCVYFCDEYKHTGLNYHKTTNFPNVTTLLPTTLTGAQHAPLITL